MQNVVVATSKSVFISDDEIRNSLSNSFGLPDSRIITRFREHDFLINCESVKEANSIADVKELNQTFFFGPGTLVFSLWSPEIGSSRRAVGNGDWINIWNLSLHCWGWSTVLEIVNLIRDLVIIRQSSSAPSVALSALVRLKPSIDLPLKVDFSVGMRRFPLLLSKRAASSPRFDRSTDSYTLSASSPAPNSTDCPPAHFTQHHSRYSKGKAAAPVASTVKTFLSDSENTFVLVAEPPSSRSPLSSPPMKTGTSFRLQ